MRFACALFLLTGCGFPDVKLVDSGTSDATVQDGSAPESGSDGGGMDAGPDVLASGCKGNMDCDKTCTGKVPMPCGCVAFLADSAPPACDSSCQATGCLNKTAVCNNGTCIIQ